MAVGALLSGAAIVAPVPSAFAGTGVWTTAGPRGGAVNSVAINPAARLRPPSEAWLLGSDPFGRDVFSRVVWGGRISLTVGVGVAVLAVFLGLAIGLIAGFNRIADAVLMRVMDGLMAIPGILLAIALVAIVGPSVTTVIVAIALL